MCKLGKKEAALDYPLDVENLSMKLEENRLLCRALREARRGRIGPLLDQELLPETVELGEAVLLSAGGRRVSKYWTA